MLDRRRGTLIGLAVGDARLDRRLPLFQTECWVEAGDECCAV
jgi:hypothetical protein